MGVVLCNCGISLSHGGFRSVLCLEVSCSCWRQCVCEEPSRDADRLLESKEEGMGTACEALGCSAYLERTRASRLSRWDVPVRGFD